MSMTDPRAAVASRILSCMQFRVEQSGERIACTIVNLGEIEQAIVTALADAERRGLERAAGICEAEALIDDERGYYGKEMAKAIRLKADEIN